MFSVSKLTTNILNCMNTLLKVASILPLLHSSYGVEEHVSHVKTHTYNVQAWRNKYPQPVGVGDMATGLVFSGNTLS